MRYIEKQFLSKIKSAEKNETDIVKPVEIKVVEVLPNGMLTIHFSERLKTFLEMSKRNNKRQLAEEFIDVTYISNNDGLCNSIKPELTEWYESEFDSS